MAAESLGLSVLRTVLPPSGPYSLGASVAFSAELASVPEEEAKEHNPGKLLLEAIVEVRVVRS